MRPMEGGEQPRPVPAGWYPDPGGAGLRWWDGDGWTEHIAAAQPAAPAEAGQHPAAAAPAAAAEPIGGDAGAGQTGAAEPASTGLRAGKESSSGQPAAGAGAPAAVSGVAAVSGERGPSRGEWALSVLLPALPLAGLIWGVYLTRRGDGSETAGNVAIVLSLVVILIAVLVLL
jgi:hypothetical protein